MRAILLLAIWFLAVYVAPAFAQRPDLVEVLEVNGAITEAMANDLGMKVDAINENPSVKAVLLVVKSPGGGVSATADLYAALSRVKVPVVGWCNYVCASGGIYILMAPSVKYIAVSDQTITGSVGVVAQVTRFNRLLDWLRVDNDIYKSGSLKTAGSPTYEPTADERKYLQEIVDEFAKRFYAVVEKARKIVDWASVKSARVYIGDQAVRVGLVDAVMSRDASIKKAKELSGSKNVYTREELKKMSRAADERPSYQFMAPVDPLKAFGDIPWAIELLKEIRRGEITQFGYRMPYEF